MPDAQREQLWKETWPSNPYNRSIEKEHYEMKKLEVVTLKREKQELWIKLGQAEEALKLANLQIDIEVAELKDTKHKLDAAIRSLREAWSDLESIPCLNLTRDDLTCLERDAEILCSRCGVIDRPWPFDEAERIVEKMQYQREALTWAAKLTQDFWDDEEEAVISDTVFKMQRALQRGGDIHD